MSGITKPLEVCGSGGQAQGQGAISYKVTLPKDHPKGERPIIIKDKSRKLAKFPKVLESTKNEKQVLILFDWSIMHDDAREAIIARFMPKNSFIEHHLPNNDNKGAADWVEYHLVGQYDNSG